MKFQKKSIALLVILAACAFAACGGGGSSSKGGGGTPAIPGTFTKEVIAAGAPSYFQSIFSSVTSENRFMMLYLAEDIKGSGLIKSISFKYNAAVASAVTCSNVTIKMGHTDVDSTNLSDTYINNIEQGKGSFKTVLDNATITIPAGAAGEYFSIVLSQPFNYNGVDNLIVQVTRTAACTASVQVVSHVTSPFYNCLVFDTGTGSATAATGSYYTASADVKFAFEGGQNNVICADATASGNSTSAPGYSGRTQMLIMASDINGSGLITGMAFNPVTTTNAAVITGMTIKIAQLPSGKTDLTGLNFADNYMGFTPVVVTQNLAYHVPALQPSAIWIPFNNSDFVYDGTSNLLIDISCTVSSGSYDVIYKASVETRMISSADPNGADGTATGPYTFEPVLRFYGGTIDIITDETTDTSVVFNTGIQGRINLYRVSELGTTGTITSVACRLNNPTSTATSYANYKIIIGHSNLDVLQVDPASASGNFVNQITAVNGTVSVPAGLVEGDWIEIPLSIPFAYDGKSNLAVWMGTTAAPGSAAVHEIKRSSIDARYTGQTANGAPGTPTVNTLINAKIDMQFKITK